MKRFKEMKVYRIADANVIESYDDTLFVCRGVACDEKRSSNFYRRMSILEERVLYTGEAPIHDSLLHRVYSGMDQKATSWYSNENDAWEAATLMKLSHPDVSHAYFNTEEIEPRSKEPFTVKFDLDEKGRPYTRFNSRPEWDGRRGKGKIFFADVDLVGADEGYATVTISKEFDTYGFLTGKMEAFEMPDMSKFLDWAWENEDPNSQILFINHPGRGRYLVLETPKKEIFRIEETSYEWSSQPIWRGMSNDRIVERDAALYTERKCSLTQLYLEDAWDRSVDLKEVEDLFYGIPETLGNWRVSWMRSCKFHNKQIDTACKQGFLSQFCVEGRQIEAFGICPENILALAHFSYSEMLELAAKVSEVNRNAEKAIQSLTRKGKL